MKNLFLPRFLSLWLILCLVLPNPAFALREIQTRNSGVEEEELAGALRSAAGAEEEKLQVLRYLLDKNLSGISSGIPNSDLSNLLKTAPNPNSVQKTLRHLRLSWDENQKIADLLKFFLNRDVRLDRDEYFPVNQREFAVAAERDPYPILKTVGLWTCMACAIYDSSSRVGLLAHFDDGVSYDNISYERMLAALERRGVTDLNGVRVKIIGFDDVSGHRILKGSSVLAKRIASELQRAISQRRGMPFPSEQIEIDLKKTVEMRVFRDPLTGQLQQVPIPRNVALDIRTGEIFALPSPPVPGPMLHVAHQRFLVMWPSLGQNSPLVEIVDNRIRPAAGAEEVALPMDYLWVFREREAEKRVWVRYLGMKGLSREWAEFRINLPDDRVVEVGKVRFARNKEGFVQVRLSLAEPESQSAVVQSSTGEVLYAFRPVQGRTSDQKAILGLEDSGGRLKSQEVVPEFQFHVEFARDPHEVKSRLGGAFRGGEGRLNELLRFLQSPVWRETDSSKKVAVLELAKKWLREGVPEWLRQRARKVISGLIGIRREDFSVRSEAALISAQVSRSSAEREETIRWIRRFVVSSRSLEPQDVRRLVAAAAVLYSSPGAIGLLRELQPLRPLEERIQLKERGSTEAGGRRLRIEWKGEDRVLDSREEPSLLESGDKKAFSSALETSPDILEEIVRFPEIWWEFFQRLGHDGLRRIAEETPGPFVQKARFQVELGKPVLLGVGLGGARVHIDPVWESPQMLAAGGGTYGGLVLYLRDTAYRAIILTEERARSLARSRRLRRWLRQKLLTAQEVKEEGRQLTGGIALPSTDLPMEIFILPKKEVHDRLPLIEESGSSVEDLKRWGASILLERLDQHVLTFTVEMNDPTARIRLNGSPLRNDPVRPLERGDRIRIYSPTAAGAEEVMPGENHPAHDDKEVLKGVVQDFADHFNPFGPLGEEVKLELWKFLFEGTIDMASGTRRMSEFNTPSGVFGEERAHDLLTQAWIAAVGGGLTSASTWELAHYYDLTKGEDAILHSLTIRFIQEKSPHLTLEPAQIARLYERFRALKKIGELRQVEIRFISALHDIQELAEEENWKALWEKMQRTDLSNLFAILAVFSAPNGPKLQPDEYRNFVRLLRLNIFSVRAVSGENGRDLLQVILKQEWPRVQESLAIKEADLPGSDSPLLQQWGAELEPLLQPLPADAIAVLQQGGAGSGTSEQQAIIENLAAVGAKALLLLEKEYESPQELFELLPEFHAVTLVKSPADFLRQEIRTNLFLMRKANPTHPIWAEEFLAEHLQSAGAEEVSLQAGRGIMMGRAVEFLNQPAIREILPVLGDPGTVTSLRETLGGVEELDILRGGLETETLLARTGISWPAAGLEAPVVKLLVDPAYRAGMEQQLAGSRAIEIVEDPAAADLMAGSEKFIWENRGRAPRAIALQIGDSSALFILNEKFLLVIASQRDKLGAGAVLVVGMQVGSEGAVLFQYL